MSSVNILASLHPERKRNIAIIRKYQPGFRPEIKINDDEYKKEDESYASNMKNAPLERQQKMMKEVAIMIQMKDKNQNQQIQIPARKLTNSNQTYLTDQKQNKYFNNQENQKIGQKNQSYLSSKRNSSQMQTQYTSDYFQDGKNSSDQYKTTSNKKFEDKNYQGPVVRQSIFEPVTHIEDKLMRNTVYQTFLKGQLQEAKPSVDNISQADAFFCALQNNIMFASHRPTKPFPSMDEVSPAKKKQYIASPLLFERQKHLLKGLKKQPLDWSARMIIDENVNQEGEPSTSDDDLYLDEQFEKKSKQITQNMIINNFNSDQLEWIEEQIRNQKYKILQKQGKITEKTLEELGFRKKQITIQNSPQDSTQKLQLLSNGAINKLKRTPSELEQEKKEQQFKITQTDYFSQATKNKKVSQQFKTSMKQLDLQQLNLLVDQDIFPQNEHLKANQQRVGLPTIARFYKKFKDLDKRVQADHHLKQADVAYMIEASKLPIIPVPTGIFNRKGDQSEINLTNQGVGNQQALALGMAIQLAEADKIYLANNRISGQQPILQIIKALSENLKIKELDLSKNNLQDNDQKCDDNIKRIRQNYGGTQALQDLVTNNQYNLQNRNKPNIKQLRNTQNGFDKVNEQVTQQDICLGILCKHLENSNSDLQALYFNECNLQDQFVISIIDSIYLSNNFKLKKLYFNNNALTDKFGIKLANFLKDSKIKEFGVAWNKLTAVSGNLIALALAENTELKVFDIGWNSLGVKPKDFRDPKNPKKIKQAMKDREIGQSWGTGLRENKSLIHLDISFNKFQLVDTEIIAEQIRFNNTCVGFHFQGNAQPMERKKGEVDSQGFIRMVDGAFQLLNLDQMNLQQHESSPDSKLRTARNRSLISKSSQQNYQLGKQQARKQQTNRISSVIVQKNEFAQFLDKDELQQNEIQEEKVPAKNLDMQILKTNHEKIYKYIPNETQFKNCWICEGWLETEFNIDIRQELSGIVFVNKDEEGNLTEFTVDQLSDDMKETYFVFIHFDFDNYQPDRMDDLRMQSLELKGKFKTHRMIPPSGNFHYFFSFKGYPFISQKQEKVNIDIFVRKQINNAIINSENDFNYNSLKEFLLGDLSFTNQKYKMKKHGKLVMLMFPIDYLNIVQSCAIFMKKMQELKDINFVSSRDIVPNLQNSQTQDIIMEETAEDYQDDDSQRMTPVSQRLHISRQKRRLTRLIQVTSEKEINSQDFQLNLQKTSFEKLNQEFENKFDHKHPFQSFSVQKMLHPSGSIKTETNENNHSASSFQTIEIPQLGEKLVQNKQEYPKQSLLYELMDHNTYEFKMIKYCQIRQNKTQAQLIRAETPWTVDIGIFKDYLKESSNQLYNSCFEEDWNTMKKLKYKMSKEEDVKQAVFKAYPLLKDTYKYQAGVSPFGNLFAIGSNQCSIFVNEVLDCLDIDKDGNLKTSDADRMFITVNAARSGPYNPANGMIRCQLIEFVIRCSIEKYFVSKIEENELDSVNRFLNEFVFGKCQGFNQTVWRQKNTFNIYVDNIMKAYTKLWEYIYKRFSGKHAKPGGKPFMMYDEFNSFVEYSGLLNNELPARDSSVIFNLSMLTQVDELNKSRHLEAKLVEFMEMITRLCNQSSLPPLTKEQIAEGNMSTTMSLAQRENQSLQTKIENAIPVLMKNICEVKWRTNFQHPLKDQKKNLYILPNGKFF